MRALAAIALVLPLALAGCLEDDPVPEPAADPEEACEARGIGDLSCATFCELNAAVCGLPAPTPAPYPVFPSPSPVTPPVGLPETGLPEEMPPLGVPALNGTAPTILPAACNLAPTLEICPQL